MDNSIKHTYHIGGMSCGGCIATAKNKLSAAPGITSVTVDLAIKQAEITSSIPLNADMLQQSLRHTHYTIAELIAPISL
jgi:copper chaperone CopZ